MLDRQGINISAVGRLPIKQWFALNWSGKLGGKLGADNKGSTVYNVIYFCGRVARV